MSKSKGNVIDPLDMIDGISLEALLAKRTGNMMQPQLAEKIAKRTQKQFPNGIEAHGTDALRFTLAALATTGRDINWDLKRLEGYRNFCNKLWNASRYVLMNVENNVENHDVGLSGGDLNYSLADKWILAEFNQTIKNYREAFDTYRFDLAANTLYDFTWNQFCDWYLELTKSILANGEPAQQRAARHTLIAVLEALLRLAHPIIPFITEEIWQSVKKVMNISADTIMLQPMPIYDEKYQNDEAVAELNWIKELIVAVRNIRAEMNIAPSKPLQLFIREASPEVHRIVHNNINFIESLAKLSEVVILEQGAKAPLSVTKLIDSAELLIPMAGLINKESELARLSKEIERIDNEISRIEGKLSNASFVDKAPAAVVAKEKEKLSGYQEDKVKLQQQVIEIEKL